MTNAAEPAQRADSAASAAVDAEHPWLGLVSFSEETLGFFYGREEEVAELARRVQRKLLTVLFGQSGLGKTSILRAGIVPRLRPQGYCPVYVRIDYGRDSPLPAEQIKQAIFRETLSSGTWSQTGVAVEGESLWEFLHHRDDLLLDASGRTLTPLLIFDQFEEIFTLAQSDDFGRQRAAQFIADLGDLVENRPPKAVEARLDADDSAAERFDFARADYRILIALREDYLAHLEGLKGAMPSITQNRMRLARMTGAQALDAVRKPGGALVSQDVAEAIVRFVAGGSELRNAEVEPSLLSLICRELNAARIAQGRSEISADLLAGSHAGILAEFYQRALADQPAGVHRFIEEELLTDSGFRENIAQERALKAFAEAGAAPGALAMLVDRRLLRIEERLDVRRVELTHDVLCEVVRASRDLRHEREARDKAERQLAEQRLREAATRKALVRARKIAGACAALAVVAVASAGLGFVSMKRAQDAEARAQQTRALAETARGESERLIVYLLDDFYRELEPVGRLDLVAELARRALGYYQGLPTELRTRDTERNRALALVRYGSVLRNQSKLDESRKALDDAVDTLDKMRQQGDNSEAAAIGLALGLTGQSRVLDSSLTDLATLPLAERAVKVLEPVAQATGSSAAARRAFGSVLTQLGFFQLRQNLEEEAVLTLEKARAAYRSIDELRADADAAANFAIATGWLVEVLSSLSRYDDAKRVGEEGRRAATQVLERHPTHMLALRGRALISHALAVVAGNEMRQEERLVLAQDSTHDWALIARVDPSNMLALNNLGASQGVAFAALLNVGRPREALAKVRETRIALEPHASSSATPTMILANAMASSAYLAGDLGAAATSDSVRDDGIRFAELVWRSVPASSFERRWLQALWDVIRVEVSTAASDFARARSIARGLRERSEQLAPPNEFAQRLRNDLLRRLHFDLGVIDFLSNDFAATEKNLRTAVAYRKLLPGRTLNDQREDADETTLLSIALARLGRHDEARLLAKPVLEFHRGLHSRRHDDQRQKLQLIVALYASALATPAEAKPLLNEAQSLFNTLPADMRGLRSTAVWQQRLTEAQQSPRQQLLAR